MKERTRERLLKAGWTPERRLNKEEMEEIERLYISAGMIIPVVVRGFLEFYGKLHVEFVTNSLFFPNFLEKVDFDPFKITSYIMEKEDFDEIPKDFNEVKDEEFFPVGSIYGDSMILMMTRKGKFFSMMGTLLCRGGKDIEEMLDCIVGRYNVAEILKDVEYTGEC
jgi:hypothetical protein